MREILFRGKRIDNGEWAEGYLWIGNDFLCITPHNVGISYDEKAKRVIAFAHEVDRKTVCQYTGLTDKNGRKIFEGDIIEDIDYGYMRCMYKGGTFIWYNEKGFGIKFMTYIPTIEVIGNIFDNPEFMKWRNRLDR